ncbi:MAG: hypothetical protein AUI01_05335 [Ktedonobacter sp. 13_2_20CM_2_56_8]|nr:MAG: hypothetical protein AUI01_05335 [Ktedonobacter sp. 13_2_20CM_2_56_8]
MLFQRSLHRLGQLLSFLSHPSQGQFGQLLWVLLSVKESPQDSPPRFASDIGHHGGQFDIGVLHHLLNATLQPRSVGDQTPTVAR